MRLSVLMIVGSIALSPTAFADEWPQFRGPNNAGVAGSAQLPSEWSADKNVQWKVKVPGVAWSQPIVWGDKVFVTTAITENQRKPTAGFGGGFGGPPGGRPKGPGGPGGAGGRPGGPGGGFGGSRPPDQVYQWEIHCLDRATGKTIWKQQALEAKPKIATHASNTFATETPVTDGERVYAYFGMHGVYCFDMGGTLVWKKDLGSFQMMMGWGTAASPVLIGEHVFVQIDNEQKSFLVALDRKTGTEKWRINRDEKTTWGSPVIWKNKVRTELVAPGSQRVRSYEPETGKVLWELRVGGGQCSSTPVGDDERLYVGVGRRMMAGGMGGGPPGGGRPGGPGGGGMNAGNGDLFAVKAGATGDITPKDSAKTSDGIAWTAAKAGPPMASPVVYQGYIYVLEQNGGMVSCYDAATGKAAYTKERIPNARAFWASPWAGDGKIFCLDDAGTTHVLKAGPEFKVLSKSTIGEMTWASPAIAGGALILRGVDHVYCIGK